MPIFNPQSTQLPLRSIKRHITLLYLESVASRVVFKFSDFKDKTPMIGVPWDEMCQIVSKVTDKSDGDTKAVSVNLSVREKYIAERLVRYSESCPARLRGDLLNMKVALNR